ncbi:protein of unknown function [Frankineae bacterium MT45]|nr:protein of unknown function [Frankineae bacterium MT45]
MASPTPAIPAASASLISSWQGLLAAEHAAVFAYRRLGPQLAAADRELARTYEAAHRSVRDELSAGLLAAGQTPVRTEADYPLAEPLSAPSAAVQAAVGAEESCATAARLLLLGAASTTAQAPAGSTLAKLRATALSELTDSAVRATRWRIGDDAANATVPFPGVE